MFRRISDFTQAWQFEMESTVKVLRNLTDESLGQAVVPGGRTLGFLAWHITVALAPTFGASGMQLDTPDMAAPVPTRAADIVAAYERTAHSVLEQVPHTWSDEQLEQTVPFFGRDLPAGIVLEAAIKHQAHHRGQMTVLMRQAGLKVPGVYGPAREEWAAFGMEPLA